MDGRRPTTTAFFAGFLTYLLKVVFWISVSIFAIHRLHDAFGAGLVVGSAKSAQPAFETRIAGREYEASEARLARVETAIANPSMTSAPAKFKSANKKEPLQTGKASFYGKRWSGRQTANGEIFDHRKFTAAHKKLPFGTYVRVVRADSKESVVVRINDRGPFVKGRIIDLSSAAAAAIDMVAEGVVKVELYSANVADYLKQFKNEK